MYKRQVIGVAIAYIVSYRIIIKGICNECKGLGIFLILLMLVCFLLFTWFAPQIGLFKDQMCIRDRYGVRLQARSLP